MYTYSNLKTIAQASNLPYYTAYTYDKDNRTTKITFDSDTNKVTYTYDKLGRVQKRVATVGESNYETTYAFVPGDTTKYGSGATTVLVKKITQRALFSNPNTMNAAISSAKRETAVKPLINMTPLVSLLE